MERRDQLGGRHAAFRFHGDGVPRADRSGDFVGERRRALHSIPDEGVDIGEINIRKNATIHLFGGPVRFGTSSSQSPNNPRIRDEGTSCSVFYYCPIDFTRKDTTLNKAYFCGPVLYGKGHAFANSNYVRYYGNAWATNTSTTVEGPMPNAFFSIGSGRNDYYSRMSAAAQTGVWRTFAGSPCLRRTGDKHDLAAGATVHGTGIPEGAYVARIVDDATILLSEPCTASSDDAGVSVAFDAFENVKTIAYVKGFGNQASGKEAGDSILAHCFVKLRENDVFDIHAEYINSHVMLDSAPAAETLCSFGTGTGMYRARVFLERAAVGSYYAQFGHIHLVFAPKDGVLFPMNAAGFAGATTWNAAYGPILETTAGLTAKIDGVKRWTSAVTKTGPGTLDVTSATENNHFMLKVQEGVTALRMTRSDGSQWLNRLAVDAGATFRLAEGTLKIMSPNQNIAAQLTLTAGAVLEVAEGATLDLSGFTTIPEGVVFKGPGTFVLPSVASTAGVTLQDAPIFRFVKQGGVRDAIMDGPITPEVVGHPAFWVDAAKNYTPMSFTWTNFNSSTTVYNNGVSYWGDCRDGETTYYATNDWSGVAVGTTPRVPGRTGVVSGKPVIEFNGLAFPGQNNGRFAWSGMVWNRPITNVCAVFSVYVYASGGQAALGCTKRFTEMGTARNNNDFLRGVTSNQGGGIGTTFNRILNNEAAACVRNGWIFANGVSKVHTDSVPDTTFTVLEYHPVAPYGRADAFAIQEHGGVSCSGCQKLAECIVYTNELSMAERRQVCAYLMGKYGLGSTSTEITDNRFLNNADVNALAKGAPFGIEVPVGGMAGVTAIDAAEDLVKTGPGLLYVDHVNGAALDVRGGTVEVLSRELTESVIPEGYFVHLDANDTNRMTIVNTKYADNVTRPMVRNWRPKNPGDAVSAQKRTTDGRYYAPWLAYPEALGGKPVLDFGPFVNANTSWNCVFMDYVSAESTDGSSMSYAKLLSIGSAFVMIGSREGGGVPFSYYDYNPWRTATSDPAVPFFNSNAPAVFRNGSGWIDGVKKKLTETGLNGGYQVVSALGTGSEACNILGMNAAASRQYTGGGEIGEILIYAKPLDTYSHQLVDRYLNWKWLGIGFPGYRPSTAGAVTVAAGATLKVAGGAPFAVTSLAGAGTVEGDVTFAGDAVIEVPVAADGSVATLTVDGSLDLSKGGVIRLTGHPEALAKGAYRIVSATSVTKGGRLTVAGYTGLKALAVHVDDTGVTLIVSESGTVFIFR